MKTAIIAASILGMSAPAFAGPYVNVESNSSFTGNDYSSTQIDSHLGYESKVGDKAKAYVQMGPALILKEGASVDTELSAKTGIKVALTEQLSTYGEFKFTTGDANKYGLKAGVKYAF